MVFIFFRKDDETMELKKKVEQERVRLVDLERQMTEQAVREAVDSAMARLPKDVQGKGNFSFNHLKNIAKL